MAKLFNWNVSLKSKLSLAILLFLCLPFVVLGALWYTISDKSVKENAKDYNKILLQQTVNYLESYFLDLERVTVPLVMGRVGSNVGSVIDEFMSIDPKNYYDNYVVSGKIKREILSSIIYGRKDIENITLISSKGNVMSNTTQVSAIKHYEELKPKIKAEENLRGFQILGVSYIGLNPMFSIYRCYCTNENLGLAGAIVIDLNFSAIAKIVEPMSFGKSGISWIEDADGTYVYHPDRQKIGKSVDTAIMRRINDSRKDYFIDDTGTDVKLVLYQKSELTGWLMVSEVPLKELTSGLNEVRNLTIVILCLIVVLSLIILGGFSYYLTKSLMLLQRLMKRAEMGDLNVQAPEKNDDEISNLNRSFNNMVKEIRRLVEVVHTAQLKEKEAQIKQKESMLSTLQSQINPHFLYNSLEVINSYAIVEGVMPISNMAAAIAEIFRYSVGSNNMAKLQDEIQYIKTYFEIQAERYDSISLVFAFDDEQHLERVSCPRLTIQPLIENAFIHGYEKHHLEPEYFAIEGEKKEAYYALRVIDKGKGMPCELREKYNHEFALSISNEMIVGDWYTPFQRIGLWNVHKRIRVTLGEPYGLHIIKSDRTGTVMEVRLPYT